MADESKLCEVLPKVLENLTSEDLGKFNTNLKQRVVDYYPKISASTLQSAILPNTVSQMVKAYDEKTTAEIYEMTLNIMNQRYLAQSVAGIKGSLYPVVPYDQVLYEGLKNKMVITIKGRVKHNAQRFNINLYKDNDVAFHFNPRFNEDGKQVIVRNSRERFVWGVEEKELSSPFPFTPGKEFEVKIMCTDSGFRVDVDNKHLLNFAHRIKEIGLIRKLNVEFDVYLTSVSIDPAPLWMTKQYAYVLSDVISENTTITIPVHVKPNAKVFAINLMKDNDIFLHLKPIFSDDGKVKEIVRNSTTGGSWGSEEKDTPFPMFARGKPFLVKIKCTKDKFEVTVDERSLQYNYRGFDFTKINKVEIREDVIAWGVQVQPCMFLP